MTARAFTRPVPPIPDARLALRSPGGALVVAEKHEGAAGPPSAEEVCLLKEELADLTG